MKATPQSLQNGSSDPGVLSFQLGSITCTRLLAGRWTKGFLIDNSHPYDMFEVEIGEAFRAIIGPNQTRPFTIEEIPQGEQHVKLYDRKEYNKGEADFII